MAEQTFDVFEIRNLIRDIFRIFMRRINDQETKYMKLTHEQFGLLYMISRKEDEVIQQDMAHIMRKDKSVILRTLDTLEEKGLVRRVVDQKDRRKKCLMVTKTGIRLIESYEKIGKEIMREVGEGISDNDAKIFKRVLNRMGENTLQL